MTHPAASSPLWRTAWRTQRGDGPALVGGAYDPDVLEAAYRHGYFPMVEDVPRRYRTPSLPGPARELTWWAPRVRPVIIRSTVHIGRRLRQALRRCGWTTTMDRDFAGVLRRCGPQRGEETWLSEELVEAYVALNARGVSHSIEVWSGDTMVAGAFGSVIGGVFCGDSAFRTSDYGAKIAILDLCQRVFEAGVVMVDCQDPNNGLDAIGSVPIGLLDYLAVLGGTAGRHPVLPADPRPVERLLDWAGSMPNG